MLNEKASKQTSTYNQVENERARATGAVNAARCFCWAAHIQKGRQTHTQHRHTHAQTHTHSARESQTHIHTGRERERDEIAYTLATVCVCVCVYVCVCVPLGSGICVLACGGRSAARKSQHTHQQQGLLAGRRRRCRRRLPAAPIAVCSYECAQQEVAQVIFAESSAFRLVFPSQLPRLPT